MNHLFQEREKIRMHNIESTIGLSFLDDTANVNLRGACFAHCQP